MAQLLLKNGTALIHGENDKVEVVHTDILIEGNIVTKIAANIAASQARVIDCKDKIISPGFVDTHHHVWQTQLKGRHADQTLLQYLGPGNSSSSLFTAKDIFWGELGGCLEMIDCGTTTVVDYAHLNYSPDNTSGIRSIFCYSPNPRVKSWDPFEQDSNALSGHILPTLEDLAKHAPYADRRITIGFAFDGFPFLPKEYLDVLMGTLEKLKIPLIQFHYLRGPLMMGGESVARAIDRTGYLDSRFLVAHSSNMTKEDGELYRMRGVHVSTTPSTELQMGFGFPLPAYAEGLGVTDICSLGVDCHSIASSYIPGEAKLALQSARASRGQQFLEQGKTVQSVLFKVEEAFNQATIRGARAAKMGDKLGCIAEGKLADLVIFDATSPAMVCAAIHDPIAAIILHSSPADIDTVIVDGIIRKENGKLNQVKLDLRGTSIAGTESLAWSDVAVELTKSRAELQKKIEPINMKAVESALMTAFHVNEADIVDSL